jgi:hypothetical protein
MPEEQASFQHTPRPEFDINELPKANKDPNVPKMYFNGFLTGMTNADVVMLTKLNNEPVAVLNFSLSVAKTLVRQLSQLIVRLEENSENEIMTIDVIDKALAKIRNDGQK